MKFNEYGPDLSMVYACQNQLRQLKQPRTRFTYMTQWALRLLNTEQDTRNPFTMFP